MAAASTIAGESDGAIFRAFVRDLVEASGAPKDIRAEKLREAIARNIEVFRRFGDGRWGGSRGKDFDTLIKESNLGNIKAAAAQNDVILDVIDKARGAANGVGHIEESVVAAGRISARMFSELTFEERMTLLRTPGSLPFQVIADKVMHGIADLNLTAIESVRLLTGGEGSFRIGDLPITSQELAELIGKYFSAMPTAERHEIVVGLLRLPPDASAEKQLSTLLQRTGPVLQKLFQLIGKNAQSPVVAGAMNDLLEHLEPIHNDQVRATFEKSLGEPVEKYFKVFDEGPVKVGTVGQVHRATLHSGEVVAVKIRRQDITDRAERELSILKKIAFGTPLETMVNKIDVSLRKELDFRIEADHLRKASIYHHPRLGIDIASQVENVPHTESLLVTRWARGRSMAELEDIKNVSKEDLVVYGKALSNTLERWFDEAIFGSGFFHGDLHPGNIFLDITPGEHPGFKVTIIDFGNAGLMTIKQRQALAQFSIGAYSKSPDEMLFALETLAPLPQQMRESILRDLKKVNWKKLPMSERIRTMLSICVAHKMDLPEGFLGFQRGRMFIETQLAEVNAKLERLDPEGRLPRFKPMRRYLKVTLKRLGLDIPKQLLSEAARENSVVPIHRAIESIIRSHPKLQAKLQKYFLKTAEYNHCIRNAIRGFLP